MPLSFYNGADSSCSVRKQLGGCTRAVSEKDTDWNIFLWSWVWLLVGELNRQDRVRSPCSLHSLHVPATPCLRNSCREVHTHVGASAKCWQPLSLAILSLGKSPAFLCFQFLISKVTGRVTRFKWGDAGKVMRDNLMLRHTLNVSYYYCHI